MQARNNDDGGSIKLPGHKKRKAGDGYSGDGPEGFGTTAVSAPEDTMLPSKFLIGTDEERLFTDKLYNRLLAAEPPTTDAAQRALYHMAVELGEIVRFYRDEVKDNDGMFQQHILNFVDRFPPPKSMYRISFSPKAKPMTLHPRFAAYVEMVTGAEDVAGDPALPSKNMRAEAQAMYNNNDAFQDKMHAMDDLFFDLKAAPPSKALQEAAEGLEQWYNKHCNNQRAAVRSLVIKHSMDA